MKNLAKTYDPKSFESRIYKAWEEDGDFIANNKSDKESYSIVMPPPNVTGNLHLGHAMNSTLQDILIRWKRMKGFEVLWIPGTDHASISTEAKVVEKLRKEGKNKEQLGRESFLKEAWAWTREYGGNIQKQLRKMGVSCDWTRSRFTLDEGLSKAVVKVFHDLYHEGLIYRGDRIVNWCPHCVTALSDAEVNHEDEHGKIWYIRYPYKDKEGYVVIATTRPETMLGDLAVAVHPDDERFQDLVGEKLILPLVDREIPLVADAYVDMEFGSGCVKITPSHDPNDYEVGQKHDLGQCIVIDEQAKIVPSYGSYSGLDRYEARKKIVEDLNRLGYLDHIEEHDHSVGHCDRCDTTIEPLLSKQWFLAMKELAKPAKEVVEKKEVNLIPSRFEKIYYNWLDNIRDWCISRQLWWGHRIPVWYCQECGEEIVSLEEEVKVCPNCSSHHLKQDEDSLDTWFSSALWPFSTMGWPDQTDDLKKFFPTDTLVTGYDILFFWVIRMVFSSLHNTGKIPFTHVYFNGLVRDELGRKMSKSLGNGIDPLVVIDQYGADALRFSLISGNTPGNDTRFSEEKVTSSRNFANKLWNASRFFLMNYEDKAQYTYKEEDLELEDKWILSRLNELIETINRNLEKFEFGLAAASLYEFIWFNYCDWYLEFVKSRLYGDDEERKNTAMAVLSKCLESILKLLHPFMPFITEEIWQNLPFTSGKIIHESFPEVEDIDYAKEEEAIHIAIDAITSIRNERANRNILPSKKSDLYLYAESEDIRKILRDISYEFLALASAKNVFVLDEEKEFENAAVLVREQIKIFLPLDDLVDYKEELDKLKKEEKNLQNEVKRASNKLSNQGFVSKAPKEVVEKEKEKLASYEKMLEEVQKTIVELKEKLGNV